MQRAGGSAARSHQRSKKAFRQSRHERDGPRRRLYSGRRRCSKCTPMDASTAMTRRRPWTRQKPSCFVVPLSDSHHTPPLSCINGLRRLTAAHPPSSRLSSRRSAPPDCRSRCCPVPAPWPAARLHRLRGLCGRAGPYKAPRLVHRLCLRRAEADREASGAEAPSAPLRLKSTYLQHAKRTESRAEAPSAPLRSMGDL